MNSTKKLFLNETYEIDGVEVTGEKIKESVLAFELLKLQKSQR